MEGFKPTLLNTQAYYKNTPNNEKATDSLCKNLMIRLLELSINTIQYPYLTNCSQKEMHTVSQGGLTCGPRGNYF